MRKCTVCRQKNIREVSIMNKIKEYFTNVGYASKIIWTASKKYFILKFILSLISSVLPYLPLFLWRELINALVEAIGGNAEQIKNRPPQANALICTPTFPAIPFAFSDAVNNCK